MSIAGSRLLFDEEKAAAFAERIGATLDAGAVSVMLSIGHRMGLFDVLAELSSATSPEIAAKAEVAERYLREWLAVMVTARIVEYDPLRKSYRLPPEHAACLTRDAPLGNLALFGQHVAMMGSVQDRVLACFESGEGTSYGDYPCLHRIMAEDSRQTVTAALFDHILPLAEGVTARLESGIEAMDAGCGRGSALLALAERFPASRFVGYDLCADAIAFAERARKDAGLDNLRYEVRDLTGFSEAGRFDLVTSFDAVHDQKDPKGLIFALRAALRPGGVYLLQDIGGSAKLENNLDFPLASFLYAISCIHCTPVSIGQGGAGLGTMWGWETAEAMLREAGFREVIRHVLPHDPMNVWFVARV